MPSSCNTFSQGSSLVFDDEKRKDCCEERALDVLSDDVSTRDPLVVAFEGPDDPANPRNWSKKYKWTLVALMSLLTTMTNLGTLMCTPAVPLIQKELHSTDNSFYTTLLVSIWELGEACGPLLIAPLSEYFGRSPVYHTANILFMVCSAITGASTNTEMLVAFRFLNGLSIASIVLNPPIVGDLFVTEEQGRVQSLMQFLPLIGPVFGPTFGGYIAQNMGWRWIFWIVAICTGVLEVAFLFVFQETYKVTILRRKTIKLQNQVGNSALRPEIDRPQGIKLFLQRAIFRPVRIFCLSPVIMLLAVYVSIVFAYLYILLTTMTQVFENNYGFSTSSASLVYIGLGLGMVVGIFCCQFTLDRYVRRMRNRRSMEPEQRLVPMIISGFVIPIGLIWYGWSVEKRLHWIMPVIGLGFCGFAVAATLIPPFSYLVHAFEIHAASAVAGVITLRCITGVVLPLAGPSLFEKLGLGWGSTLLGLIAIAFLPVPILVKLYGRRLRQWSNLAENDGRAK